MGAVYKVYGVHLPHGTGKNSHECGLKNRQNASGLGCISYTSYDFVLYREFDKNYLYECLNAKVLFRKRTGNNDSVNLLRVVSVYVYHNILTGTALFKKIG